MRVVETLTRQHPETSLRTDFRTMQSLETDEAMIRCKEKVGIGTCQMREHIKSCTVYGYKDRGCKGNLTDLRRILHLSLAKGNPK
jgi:hypothetical protein